MFSFINKWFDKRIIKRSTITAEQWNKAYASLPILAGLSDDECKKLRELAILFLHQKIIEGVQGLVITLPMTLIIALQACLPILKLGLERYAGWLTIIVYPSGFAPKRVVTDEYGVEHHVQSNLSGEAWQQGPIVLSWSDTEFAGMLDGSNLVIHEFAHKLDMQNGVANGFPPLHANMKTKKWIESFSVAYEDFQQKCSHGKTIGIDCYAASSPAEFFAVVSEVFFERPDVIQKYYPAIYEQLRQYYHQDPIMRLSQLIGIID